MDGATLTSDKNVQENPLLRTYDLISLLFLLLIVGCSVCFVLSRRGHQSKSERAVTEMRLLSEQILDQSLSTGRTVASEGQSLASLQGEGRIAKDPWGHPYFYKVLTQESGTHGVIVWSSGPDGVPDTRDWDLRMGTGKGAFAINYRGDDLGYLAE